MCRQFRLNFVVSGGINIMMTFPSDSRAHEIDYWSIDPSDAAPFSRVEIERRWKSLCYSNFQFACPSGGDIVIEERRMPPYIIHTGSDT